MSSPAGHFGLSYGSVAGNTVTLITSKAGPYNVCVFADRADPGAAGWTDVVDEPTQEDEE
jgi:hypothetical protein